LVLNITELDNHNILVTGAAGFIGFHLCKKLIKEGFNVIGVDNINDYYSVDLKFDRLNLLGINKTEASCYNQKCSSNLQENNFSFYKLDIEDREELPKLFKKENITVVCNLAAQAGVRNSIDNPEIYVDTNIVGFLNILECCRNYNIKHLVYASSSSVYGLNKQTPFSTTDVVETPISLYAATKKSNELMAHTYSHLYKITTTGLRFFTVYGPWGRPDMAMFLFTDAIENNKPIKIFNNGEMERDFTYVDDIVEGVYRVIKSNTEERVNSKKYYKIYNIGNNKSVKLTKFISEIENNFSKKAIKEFLPMQPGDVKKTLANVDDLINDYQYAPKTTIEYGVKEFVDWYKDYNSIK
jgi:UDP-glucuronate 4-epimerase